MATFSGQSGRALSFFLPSFCLFSMKKYLLLLLMPVLLLPG